MKLKEFIKNLNDMAARDPEVLEFTVVSSIDDEGNGFNEVVFSPSTGNWEDREFEQNRTPINCICIN